MSQELLHGFCKGPRFMVVTWHEVEAIQKRGRHNKHIMSQR